MKRIVFSFSFVLFFSLAFAQTSRSSDDVVEPGLSQYANVVSVNGEKGKLISKEFWGTNLLSWINDDERLANGEKQLLADIPIQLLRYPGGTVADNFDWSSSSLYNKQLFPKKDGSETTDFQEFMALCRDLNAQPILVVNTQRFAYMNDVEAGAAHAAAWVKYCKDNNFKVKYWEIGNETYLHHILTASEYADLVKIYAAAMKAVDPTIKVFANGRWKWDDAGAKDEVKPEYRDSIVKIYYNAEFGKKQRAPRDNKKIIADLSAKNGIISEENAVKWWPTVASECGDVIDGFVVHYYYNAASVRNSDPKDFPNEQINVADRLIKTRETIEKYSGRKDLLFAMTEYNCNNKNARVASTGLAEGIGRFLDAGVDIANFWPFTFSGHNDGVMLDRDNNNKIQYPYIIVKEMSSIFTGYRVRCTHNQKKNYYAVASQSDNNTAVMISNSNGGNLNVTIDLTELSERAALSKQNIYIAQYVCDNTDKLTSNFIKYPVTYSIGDGFLNVSMKGHAVLFLNLEQKGKK